TRFSRDWSSDVCSSDLTATSADIHSPQAQGVAYFLGVVIFAAADGVTAPADYQVRVALRMQQGGVAQHVEYRVGDTFTGVQIKLGVAAEFITGINHIAQRSEE